MPPYSNSVVTSGNLMPCHRWLFTLLFLRVREIIMRRHTYVLEKKLLWCESCLLSKMYASEHFDYSALSGLQYFFKNKLLLPSCANWWVIVWVGFIFIWSTVKHSLINKVIIKYKNDYGLNEFAHLIWCGLEKLLWQLIPTYFSTNIPKWAISHPFIP